MKTQNKNAICDNCGKAWNYTGKNTVFVTCPNCRKLVKLYDVQKEAKEVKEK